MRLWFRTRRWHYTILAACWAAVSWANKPGSTVTEWPDARMWGWLVFAVAGLDLVYGLVPRKLLLEATTVLVLTAATIRVIGAVAFPTIEAIRWTAGAAWTIILVLSAICGRYESHRYR